MRVVPPLTGRLDMALSNYAKGVRNADLITDLLFPRVEVLRQTDRYYIYGSEDLQLTEQTLRAPGTPAAEAQFTMSTDYYFAASRALKGVIPDEDRLAFTGDLEQLTVQRLQAKVLLEREYRSMGKVTNTSIYPTDHLLALSGGAQWDQAGSDVLGVLKLARTRIAKSIGLKMNTAVLSFDVAEALRVHPQLLLRFQGVLATGTLNDAQLAQMLSVDRVIVAGAIAEDPTTKLRGFIWSNLALFCNTTPTTGPAGVIGMEGTIGAADIGYGKSFTWVGGPQTINGYGVTIARHPDATAKTDIVGVDWYSDEKVTAPEAGFLVTSPLATAG